MILSLARMWDFVGCKALETFIGTDPSASRCSINCCTLMISAPGLAVVEGRYGYGDWVHPQWVGV